MSFFSGESLSEAEVEKTKANIVSGWNSSAEAYLSNLMTEVEAGTKPHLGLHVGRSEVAARVISALKDMENPVVLDVGGAGGEPALSIAKEIPHATVHGTDVAPRMVDLIRDEVQIIPATWLQVLIAKRRKERPPWPYLGKRGEEAGVPNLKASVEDGELLSGFSDASVDAVTCTWALEAMTGPKKALGQFYRVLKPGGTAVIAAWDKDPNSIALKIFQVVGKLKDSKPIDIQPLGGDAGVKFMEAAGFKDVTSSLVSIPLFVPPGISLTNLFAHIVKSTPINGILEAMEQEGMTDVREKAGLIFEADIQECIAQGCAPTGPGISQANIEESSEGKNAGQLAFRMEARVIQGFKTGD